MTFLNTEKIQKLRGRSLQADEVFLYGPTFNEFDDSLNAFFKHILTDDNEKINALGLFFIQVYPSQILNQALIWVRFSYEGLIRCLKRSYITKNELNFYKASQHLINIITNKSNPRDLEKYTRKRKSHQTIIRHF